MEQRDQGDERNEDATVIVVTVLQPEDIDPRLGFALWLREHHQGCKGGAEDVPQ